MGSRQAAPRRPLRLRRRLPPRQPLGRRPLRQGHRPRLRPPPRRPHHRPRPRHLALLARPRPLRPRHPQQPPDAPQTTPAKPRLTKKGLTQGNSCRHKEACTSLTRPWPSGDADPIDACGRVRRQAKREQGLAGQRLARSLGGMTVASTLFRFEDSYAREVPGLCVPWTAAPAPDPELLVLNEELAARARRRSCGTAGAAGRRAAGRAGPGGGHDGRPGLRRPPVRRLLAPPRGRPRAAARRGDRYKGAPPRPSSQGVRAHPVLPGR